MSETGQGVQRQLESTRFGLLLIETSSGVIAVLCAFVGVPLGCLLGSSLTAMQGAGAGPGPEGHDIGPFIAFTAAPVIGSIASGFVYLVSSRKRKRFSRNPPTVPGRSNPRGGFGAASQHDSNAEFRIDATPLPDRPPRRGWLVYFVTMAATNVVILFLGAVFIRGFLLIAAITLTPGIAASVLGIPAVLHNSDADLDAARWIAAVLAGAAPTLCILLLVLF